MIATIVKIECRGQHSEPSVRLAGNRNADTILLCFRSHFAERNCIFFAVVAPLDVIHS